MSNHLIYGDNGAVQATFEQTAFDPFTSMSVWSLLAGSIPPSTLVILVGWVFYNQLKDNRKVMVEAIASIERLMQTQKEIVQVVTHIKENLSIEHTYQTKALDRIENHLNTKL